MGGMPYPFHGPWSDEVVLWFGEWLRRQRRAALLSQRKLERLSGVDQTTICRIENGQRPGVRLVVVARLLAGIESTSGRWPPVVSRRPPEDDKPDLSYL